MEIQMIEFAYPYLFFLLLLPFVIHWSLPVYKEKKESLQVPFFLRLVDVTGEKPQSGAVVLKRKRIQKLLVAFAWCCLVTAMAKPEQIGAPISQQKSARDLMIAVDLSGSMSVQDFVDPSGKKVTRLAAVKTVLAEFAKNRKGDRLGLILFGDAPYLQAPFTDDFSTWLALLNAADIGMAGQSTAFGDAIGLSISVFENSQTDNRMLIVLTDGNDNGSKVPPIDAAKIAADKNIKIYSIAIGDPIATGEEKVDLSVLNSVAESTGGQSYQALDTESLQQVYAQIDELEPQQFDSKSFRPRTSIHHYFILMFALTYLLALAIVSHRSSKTTGVDANG